MSTFETTPTTPPTPLPPCYFAAVGNADALAAVLPAALIPAYLAAGSGDRLAAIQIASADIDAGQRYQGRKYHLHQTLEFPRAPYSAGMIPGIYGQYGWDWENGCDESGLLVWDWDKVNKVAIVPRQVQVACLYQADSIIAATRDPRLADIHDGVRQQQNSGLMETLDRTAPGAVSGLCRRAYQELVRYRLVSGRMT